MFRLTLTGKLLPNADRKQAVQLLTKLFSVEPEQANRMLQGNTFPIKKNLSAEMAKTLYRKLTSIGIECKLMKAPQPEAVESPQPAPAKLQAKPKVDLPVNSSALLDIEATAAKPKMSGPAAEVSIEKSAKMRRGKNGGAIGIDPAATNSRHAQQKSRARQNEDKQSGMFYWIKRKRSRLLMAVALMFVSGYALVLLFRTDHLQPDPELLVGELDNGLHYSIRQRAAPTEVYLGQVSSDLTFMLSLPVGSLHELEDERGATGFILGLIAFGGQHLNKKELDQLAIAPGKRPQLLFSGTADYDRATLMVGLDDPDPASMKTAVRLIRNLMDGLAFTQRNVDQHRTRILEHRERYGDLIKIQRSISGFVNGTSYGTKPKGKNDDIEAITPQVIKRFHQRWYRPELMSLAVVGDLKPDQMNQLILKELGAVAPRNGPEAVIPPLSQQQGVRGKVIIDSDFHIGQITWQKRLPTYAIKTMEQAKYLFCQELYQLMLNDRLIMMSSTSKYVQQASIRLNNKNIQIQDVMIMIRLKGVAYEKALMEVMQEVVLVDKLGFTEIELEKAKPMLLMIKKKMNERRTHFPGHWIAEMDVRNIEWRSLYTSTSPEYDLSIASTLLPEITLDDVLSAGNELLPMHPPLDNQFIYWMEPSARTSPIEVDSELEAFNELMKTGSNQVRHD